MDNHKQHLPLIVAETVTKVIHALIGKIRAATTITTSAATADSTSNSLNNDGDRQALIGTKTTATSVTTAATTIRNNSNR